MIVFIMKIEKSKQKIEIGYQTLEHFCSGFKSIFFVNLREKFPNYRIKNDKGLSI